MKIYEQNDPNNPYSSPDFGKNLIMSVFSENIKQKKCDYLLEEDEALLNEEDRSIIEAFQQLENNFEAKYNSNSPNILNLNPIQNLFQINTGPFYFTNPLPQITPIQNNNNNIPNIFNFLNINYLLNQNNLQTNNLENNSPNKTNKENYKKKEFNKNGENCINNNNHSNHNHNHTHNNNNNYNKINGQKNGYRKNSSNCTYYYQKKTINNGNNSNGQYIQKNCNVKTNNGVKYKNGFCEKQYHKKSY